MRGFFFFLFPHCRRRGRSQEYLALKKKKSIQKKKSIFFWQANLQNPPKSHSSVSILSLHSHPFIQFFFFDGFLLVYSQFHLYYEGEFYKCKYSLGIIISSFFHKQFN